jgi:trehalose-6-phosphate synthase
VSICQVIVNEDRYSAVFFLEVHYHPGEITFDESAWEAYKEANRLFAKAICKEVQDVISPGW